MSLPNPDHSDPNPSWDALWQQDYAHTIADPALHAAHQIEIAARILLHPDQFDAPQITWARTIFCS